MANLFKRLAVLALLASLSSAHAQGHPVTPTPDAATGNIQASAPSNSGRHKNLLKSNGKPEREQGTNRPMACKAKEKWCECMKKCVSEKMNCDSSCEPKRNRGD